ncbi:MAG: hypothetical protein ACD_34C00192G0003, partial [uncultured bacterium]
LSLLLKFKENTTTGEVAPGAVQEA